MAGTELPRGNQDDSAPDPNCRAIPRPDKLREYPQGGQAMPMMTIGLDISKSWFQIHWITEDGEIVRKKLARGKVLDFFS